MKLDLGPIEWTAPESIGAGRVIRLSAQTESLAITQDFFAAGEGSPATPPGKQSHHDILLVHFQNLKASETRIVPRLRLTSPSKLLYDRDHKRVMAGTSAALYSSHSIELTPIKDDQLTIQHYPLALAPKGEKSIAFFLVRGDGIDSAFPVDVPQAESLRARALGQSKR